MQKKHARLIASSAHIHHLASTAPQEQEAEQKYPTSTSYMYDPHVDETHTSYTAYMETIAVTTITDRQ